MFQFLESSALSLYFVNTDNALLMEEMQQLRQVQNFITLLVVCNLAAIQAGAFNFCLNCTGDRYATGNEILERNILEAEFFE